MVRSSICGPYLILLIWLQNKKKKRNKTREGWKNRRKVLPPCVWGDDQPRPNAVKDMNEVLARSLRPFLWQILERNEAKFSLLWKSVVRDVTLFNSHVALSLLTLNVRQWSRIKMKWISGKKRAGGWVLFRWVLQEKLHHEKEFFFMKVSTSSKKIVTKHQQQQQQLNLKSWLEILGNRCTISG